MSEQLPEVEIVIEEPQPEGLSPVPPVEISADMPYETRYVEVLGSQIAYVEAGEGDPILFLHGNPTSKYLWRNVMPWLEGRGRIIAPDLIGMGESDKPAIGYTFAEHSRYVEGFVEMLELENLTLVIHDWGSGLGLDYAARHPENVAGIAMMEAVVAPGMPASSATMPPAPAEFFGAIRTEGVGEEMILNQNIFVEQVLPGSVVRGLTEAEMAHYRAPYADSASRLPTLVWPRQIPIDGEPADVVERVNAYNAWLMGSTLPKLHIYASPGAINPPEVIEFLSQTLHNYETVYVGQGLHFIQEDHPEAIGRAIHDWHRRNIGV
jgi:haloalkane dehalogenase